VVRRVLIVAVLLASLWGAAGLIAPPDAGTPRTAAAAGPLCAGGHQDEGDGAWHAHRAVAPPASSWHAPVLHASTTPPCESLLPAAGTQWHASTSDRAHVPAHLLSVPLLI
jgi:hypothetical protein